MKILKSVSIAFSVIVTVAALIGLGVVLSYRLNGWSMKLYKQGWADGYNYIKPIEDLQRQVGAEPDSIIGPNTIQRYKWALGNQYTEELTSRDLRKHRQTMLAKVEVEK